MSKSKIARIAGFTVALGATASLAGFAATGTGAYFSDSHDGTLSASTGSIAVAGNTTLDFANLLPGEYKTDNIHYSVTGTGPEDIWMVIPSDSPLNGPGGSPEALGRYGHFGVTSNAGSFVSNNLATSHPGDTGASCPIDAQGHGGSDVTAANRGDLTVDFCGAPTAILLDSNLTNGNTGTATVSFGFTKLMNNPAQENLPDGQVATFKLVATQHGILPSDPNN